MQAIRSYVRERDPDQLRSEMGAGAADIAEVVSDVKERLPDLKPPPQLDSPEQARFRLFDSITAFLKSASQKQPLVLVLDDLHWADQPSLLLLQFVARELGNSRLLLVGTYRDVELNRQHPLAETLGELTRERQFQRVLLRGLSRQDVSRFIEVAAGVDPPGGLAEAVHTQTEGNPLFVTEVVRLLVQEGELSQDSGTRDSWTVRIPEGVREVIGRRLNRLSQRCNETLTTASGIGREFELRQLTPLMEDISEDRLLEVLEEALSARVIEELPQAVGRYQFTHALIQETLTEELTLTRRVRLHARIAETLEQLYGDNVEAHAAELAHHFAEAEAVLGTEKLVHFSLQAGERALAAYAYEEAQGHFQRGLGAKEAPLTGKEAAKDTVEAALFFGLGRAQAARAERHQRREAVTTMRRAFDYYAEAAQVEQAVAVAEYPMHAISGHVTGRTQLLSRALELVPSDSHAEGRLLSRYGLELGRVEGDYEGAQAAFNRATLIARRERDAVLEARTVAYSAPVDFIHLRIQESLGNSLGAIELGRLTDDLFTQVSGYLEAARASTLLGELGVAKEQAASSLTLAEKLGDRTFLDQTLSVNESVWRLEGSFPTARDFSGRGLAISPRNSTLLFTRALLEYEVGDFAQGKVYMGRLLGTFSLTPTSPGIESASVAMLIPWSARITGVMSRSEEAEAAAKTVLSSPTASPVLGQIARVGLALLAQYRAGSWRRAILGPGECPGRIRRR